MIIIIDAYNYLKNVLRVSFVSSHEIQSCMQRYKKYTALRNNQIIFVFDAGPYDQVTIENSGKDVEVYYSGSWKSADDVIKDLIVEKKQEDILLVTSDREICAFADVHNIVSIGVLDFHELFQVVMQTTQKQEKRMANTVTKITSQENEYLDQLMEMGSRNLVRKDDGLYQTIEKALTLEMMTNNKKTSKFDKKLLKKIHKI